MIDKDDSGFLDKEEMSARCVRPSTCASRRWRAVGGRSYAIDATRRSPPDSRAASQRSEQIKK